MRRRRFDIDKFETFTDWLKNAEGENSSYFYEAMMYRPDLDDNSESAPMVYDDAISSSSNPSKGNGGSPMPGMIPDKEPVRKRSSNGIIDLDHRVSADAVLEFREKLSSAVIGQPDAVDAVVAAYTKNLAGLAPGGHPIANILFLGPTGSGKTRTVEATSEILLGNPNGFAKVDCAEFQHSHEVSKLIGSPPGYIGHRETRPAFDQETLDKQYTDKTKLSIVLFDEIEKSSDALWQLLLGILDKATLTLGDNRKVDFSRTLIFLTSNLGGADIAKQGVGIGFAARESSLKSITSIAKNAAKQRFSPEFMNRIDNVTVFKTLSEDAISQIFRLEMSAVQGRILSAQCPQFILSYTDAAAAKLIKDGTSPQYGARELKRVIEKEVVTPLSNLLLARPRVIDTGDTVTVDVDTNGEIKFTHSYR